MNLVLDEKLRKECLKMLKSHKTGHPSIPANFFGPSAGRFREVSLYQINIIVKIMIVD